MLKKYLFLVFLFSFPVLLLSQRMRMQPAHAIAYYYDGSVFIGDIVKEDPLYLHMVLSTEDTIRVNKELIRKLRRVDENVMVHYNGKFHFTRGLFFAAELGAGIADIEDTGSAQLDLVVGYRLDKYWSVGGGVGLHDHGFTIGNQWNNASHVALYGYGRYYFGHHKVRPYVDAKLGYGFFNENGFGVQHAGGGFFQPGVGIHFASRKNSRITLKLSQILQHLSGEDIIGFDAFGNSILSNFNLLLNRTVFTFGVEWR